MIVSGQRLRWSMRSGASGAVCLDASFAVFAMRAGECRLYWGPFHYCAFCERAAPDTPETHRQSGSAAPDVVIGQSTAGSRGSASLPREWLNASWTGVLNSDSTTSVESTAGQVEFFIAIPNREAAIQFCNS